MNKNNCCCHSELVSESMVGSAWRVGNTLNGSCQRDNGFRTKSGMTGESGRSMVEMLGVLAIIGVLSVGGISGYTTAMNKHKANEILNAAAVRAMAVSTQLQSGVTDPTLAEFPTGEEVGGAKFGDISKVGDSQFKIGFTTQPTPAVVEQMKNIAGDNVGVDGSRLLYNNDLSSGVDGKNTNVENVENGVYTCKTGFSASSKCEDCDTDYVLKGTSCVACPGGSGTSTSNTGTPVPNYSGCKCPADQEWDAETTACKTPTPACLDDTSGIKCLSNTKDENGNTITLCPGYYCNVSVSPDEDWVCTPGKGDITSLGTPTTAPSGKTGYVASPTPMTWDAAYYYCEALSQVDTGISGLAGKPVGCSWYSQCDALPVDDNEGLWLASDLTAGTKGSCRGAYIVDVDSNLMDSDDRHVVRYALCK